MTAKLLVRCLLDGKPDPSQHAKDLAAVQKHKWALQHVKHQTPEICLAAVTRWGSALEYVKEQTPEICLAAVKQNGWALQFVNDQTPEICLAAVKTGDGTALEFVKDQTLEIVQAAVTQYELFWGPEAARDPEDPETLLITPMIKRSKPEIVKWLLTRAIGT